MAIAGGGSGALREPAARSLGSPVRDGAAAVIAADPLHLLRRRSRAE